MEQKEAQRLLGFIMTNNKEARHLVGLSELRRQDSNMRPPGYEPGELPTAPLRDIQPINLKQGKWIIPVLRVQRYDYFPRYANFHASFFLFTIIYAKKLGCFKQKH